MKQIHSDHRGDKIQPAPFRCIRELARTCRCPPTCVPIPAFRIPAAWLPPQFVAILGFSWYGTRPTARPTPTQQADRIVVPKSTHSLILYSHGAVLRTYQVALGRASGPKQQQGDNRTPESRYLVNGHNARSTAHRSLHISYPNADNHAHHRTGGDIMVHRLPNGFGYIGALHRATDWIYDCISVLMPRWTRSSASFPTTHPLTSSPGIATTGFLGYAPALEHAPARTYAVTPLSSGLPIINCPSIPVIIDFY